MVADLSEVELILVDDDIHDLKLLEIFCRKANFKYKSFTEPNQALNYLRKVEHPHIIVSDISMPSMSGFNLLKTVKRDLNHSAVVFASGTTDLQSPVKAMREGAYDFFIKPVRFEIFEARMLQAIERVLEKDQLVKLEQNLYQGLSIENFVGKSEIIKEVYQTVSKVSRFDSTILITGESGVGKERVARSIHNKSKRSLNEFVAVNCASIPETLIESELFGYKKGAFTGADADKKGLIETSSGGTLFLDEVGEIPIHLQAKILRVLQEKTILPVGGKKTIPIDLRVICATHRDLRKMVKEGLFREDLYYRLNVIPLHIPPLRERMEDMSVLIPYLMQKIYQRWGEKKTLPQEVIKKLNNHNWPGNVRELENVLERAFVLSQGSQLSIDDLKIERIPQPKDAGIFNLTTDDDVPSLKEIELRYIREIMNRTETKDEAARVLGIGRKTLYRKEELLNPI